MRRTLAATGSVTSSVRQAVGLDLKQKSVYENLLMIVALHCPVLAGQSVTLVGSEVTSVFQQASFSAELWIALFKESTQALEAAIRANPAFLNAARQSALWAE